MKKAAMGEWLRVIKSLNDEELKLHVWACLNEAMDAGFINPDDRVHQATRKTHPHEYVEGVERPPWRS